MAIYIRQSPRIFNLGRTGVAHLFNLHRIGNREVVGYGLGSTVYVDSLFAIMPAIRFQEDTPHVAKLRTLEKEPWCKLSLDDKKTLYRSSFRLTLAENTAPTGVWKICIAAVCIVAGLALNWETFLWKCVHEEMPISYSKEHQKAQLIRMIILHVNPIQGLSSKWDYENMKWK